MSAVYGARAIAGIVEHELNPAKFMNADLLGSLRVISLRELFCGGTLVAITMAMHGFGMLLVLRLNAATEHRFESRPRAPASKGHTENKQNSTRSPIEFIRSSN